MTTPFRLEDLLNDPEWVKEMEKTPVGRRELKRLLAQRAKEELETNAKTNVPGYSPEEQRRLAEFRTRQQQGIERAGVVADTGREPSNESLHPYARLAKEGLPGLAAGAVNAIPGLINSLALGPINWATGGKARGASDFLENVQQHTTESLGVPAGPAASTGEFVGNVIGSIPAMGPIARASARPVAAIAEKVAPRAAEAIRASAGLPSSVPAPGRLAQGAANVAAGIPLSLLQQLGMEGASLEERAKAFGQSTLADFGFGSVFSMKPGTGGAIATPDIVRPNEASAPRSDAFAQAEAGFEAKRKATAEKAAQAEADKRALERAYGGAQELYYREKGRAAESWRKLPKEEKQKWLDLWKERNPDEASPTTPAVAPTAPEAAPTPAVAQPEVKIPETGLPIGTTLYQADGGKITKQSNGLWTSGEGRHATDSQIAGRLSELSYDDPRAATTDQPWIPNALSTPRPKARKEAKSKEKQELNIGPVIPGLDDVEGAPVPTPVAAPAARPQRVLPPAEDPFAPIEPGAAGTNLDNAVVTGNIGGTGEAINPVPVPRVNTAIVPEGFDPMMAGMPGVDPTAPPARPAPTDIEMARTKKQVEQINASGGLVASNPEALQPKISDPRRWWNSLKPGEEREAWLRSAGWEPPGTAGKIFAGDARYDALSTRAKEAAKKAHEAYLRGEAPQAPVAAKPKATPQQLVDAGHTDSEIAQNNVNHEKVLQGQVMGPGADYYPADAEWINRQRKGLESRRAWAVEATQKLDAIKEENKASGRLDMTSAQASRIFGSDSRAYTYADAEAEIVRRVKSTENYVAGMERAHELWKATQPTAPAVVKLPSKPEVTTLPDGRTLEYDWKLARRPKNISDAEIEDYLTETVRRAEAAPPGIVKEEYLKVVEKIKDDLKDREFKKGPPPPPPGAGLRLQSPGGIGGAAVGMTVGMLREDPEDPDYNAKVLAWAAAGAVGGYFGQRAVDTRREQRVVSAPRQLSTPKSDRVVRLDEGKGGPKPLETRLRDFYAESVRSIAPAERVIKSLARQYGGVVAERARIAQRNIGLWGNWISNTEQALTDKLGFRGKDGTWNEVFKDVPDEDGSLEIWSPKRILAYAQGDMEGLGELAVAARVLERDAMGVRKHPMSVEEAQITWNRAKEDAPHMLRAVKELREFHYGIAKMLYQQGRLTAKGLDAMRQQEWYTPFYYRLESGDIKRLDVFNERHLGTPDPLKAAKKGATAKVINPFEQTLVLTPRFLRAIEWGQVTQSLVDLSRVIGDNEVRKDFMVRRKPTGKEADVINRLEADAKTIAVELGVHSDDIAGLVTTLHADDPNWTSGTLTNWERGQLVTYEVNKAVFDGVKSLLPMERDLMTNMFAKTARALSAGVVNSPVFVANQFFKDAFDAAVMSRYGFNPFTDPVKALYHIYTRSPEYRQLLSLGGPGTIQSVHFLNPKKALTAVRAEGGNAMAEAWQNMREWHPIEAYKNLVLPFAEAARVGEYLKALKHGEEPIEAVYAAWNVLGNTRVQGASRLMRSLTQMTPFLRASISAQDELASRIGLGRTPEGARGAAMSRGRSGLAFAVKGLTTLVLPTLAMRVTEYLLGGDDQELRELRNTTIGQRYWFFRPSTFLGEDAANMLGFNTKDIVRIPRPHQAGVLFAATTDAAVDKWVGQDPVSFATWARAMESQTWINVVPTAGVILAGMLTGEDVSQGPGLGRSIVSERDKRLAPSEQGRLTASIPARVVGGTLGKLPGPFGSMFSPPMIDFVMRSVGGMAADDVLKSMTAVGEYIDSGYVPAKYEWPVVRQFFTHSPSTNTKSVEEFYRLADKAEGVYLAWRARSKNDPPGAFKYMQDNLDLIKIAPMLMKARSDIASLRSASVDMREMTEDYTTPARRRELQDFFAERITSHARMVVSITDHISGQAKYNPKEPLSTAPQPGYQELTPQADSVMTMTGRPEGGFYSINDNRPGSDLGRYEYGDDAVGINRHIVRPDTREWALTHELAHRLDISEGDLPKAVWDAVAEARKKPHPSSYAATDRKEWRAEVFTNAVHFLRSTTQQQLPQAELILTEMENTLPGTKAVVRHMLSKESVWNKHPLRGKL